VDLGFLEVVFWSIDIAGDRPSIFSTSGFSIIPKNCLAYEDKLSTYLLWPSAYNVSNAKDDFPEPERPVTTTNLFLGISIFMFFKLCTFAPFTIILSFTLFSILSSTYCLILD